MFQNVLVCGGGGFVGAVLTPRLLERGYRVKVLDTFWFGDFLSEHSRMTKIRGDMRNTDLVLSALEGVDAVIQLACLSNDPTSDLDAELTKAINYTACNSVIHLARKQGVRRFIYASSASVYGVREETDITEDMKLEPITLYSQYKAAVEETLFSVGAPDFTAVAVRNSTVSGYSPRMRLDLIISIFVMAALKKKLITIEGGTQLRPLIHMQDLVDFYLLLLEADHAAIHQQAFNVSTDNYKVMDVATMVQAKLPCELTVTAFTDPRSYHVNTDKVFRRLGYRPSRPISAAIDEVKDAFERGWIQDSDTRCYNIRHMKHLLGTAHEEILTGRARSHGVAGA